MIIILIVGVVCILLNRYWVIFHILAANDGYNAGNGNDLVYMLYRHII